MSTNFWTTINDLAGHMPAVIKKAAEERQEGELVIVGTGIASIRQMTLEALDYIQRADMVYYLVLDLATEAFIQEHARKCENLHQYYGTEKHRLDTYTQMAEVMLNSTRAGKLTVGVMYGHPGVFVNPSHRAIHIARQEGYEAKMLPGVSAEDCLYADLGIDPSTTGCAMFEATLLLFENERLDTRNHLIIWQPGAIGKNAMIFDNEHLHRLADYLEPQYGAHFPVIAYLAAMRPLEKPKIDKITVKDLRDADAVKRIGLNPCTTLYIPPKTLPPIKRHGSIAWPSEYPRVSEGEADEEPTGQALMPTSAFRISHPDMPVAPLYTKADKRACDGLKNFVPPEEEKPLDATAALRRAAMKVSLLHHHLQGISKDEIGELIASEPGLTDEERQKLRHHVNNVEAILKGNVPLEPPGGPVPSVNVFANEAAEVVDEVADLFEAIIASRDVYEEGIDTQMRPRLVALVR